MHRPWLPVLFALALLLPALPAAAIPGALVLAPPADCAVAAPTFDELAAVIAAPATPAPVPAAVGPVDPATEAAIRATLHAWLACQSFPSPLPLASLLTASFALMTDRAIRAELTAEGLDTLEFTVTLDAMDGSPPLDSARLCGLIAVRELALLADGRVTGTVEWGIQGHSHGRVLNEDRRRERMVFAREDGRWLIDERATLAREIVDAVGPTPTLYPD